MEKHNFNDNTSDPKLYEQIAISATKFRGAEINYFKSLDLCKLIWRSRTQRNACLMLLAQAIALIFLILSKRNMHNLYGPSMYHSCCYY